MLLEKDIGEMVTLKFICVAVMRYLILWILYDKPSIGKWKMVVILCKEDCSFKRGVGSLHPAGSNK